PQQRAARRVPGEQGDRRREDPTAAAAFGLYRGDRRVPRGEWRREERPYQPERGRGGGLWERSVSPHGVCRAGDYGLLQSGPGDPAFVPVGPRGRGTPDRTRTVED